MNRLTYSEVDRDELLLYFGDDTEPVVLPLPDRAYPVLVTDTRHHVIFVQADDADEALAYAKDRGDIHESLTSYTCSDAYIDAALPNDSWQWRGVRDDSYFGYPGTTFSEHVENHKRLLWQQEHEAKKAACAAVNHAGNEHTWANGRVECRLCYVTLAEAPTAVGGAA